MKRTFFTLAIMLFSFTASLRAADPAKPDPARVVGTVYGKPITAADIGLTEPIDVSVKFDSRDDARWNLMGRITTKFGTPIVERFVADRKAIPTAEELAEFNRSMKRFSEQNSKKDEARLAQLTKELRAPNLGANEKARLKEEQELLEKAVPMMRKNIDGPMSDDVAKMFVGAWKTERELHRVYGGKLIFQQAGVEALDARRLLFEAAEKAGDLKFDDAGVRHLFYYYSHLRHPGGTHDDAKALEKPWWSDSAK